MEILIKKLNISIKSRRIGKQLGWDIPEEQFQFRTLKKEDREKKKIKVNLSKKNPWTPA